MPIIDFPADPMAAETPPRRDGPEFFSPQVRAARRFYLDLAPSPRQPLAVVCGGFEHSAPTTPSTGRGFPTTRSSSWPVAGALVLAGQEVPLPPGTVFAYGPEVPHRITTDQHDPLAKYFVDFAGRRAVGLLDSASAAGRQRPRRRARRHPADLRRPDPARLKPTRLTAQRARRCWNIWC